MIVEDRELKIFSGQSHPEFAQKVCESLYIPLAASKIYRFSDGEIGISIEESVRGADVYVIPVSYTHLFLSSIVSICKKPISASNCTVL